MRSAYNTPTGSGQCVVLIIQQLGVANVLCLLRELHMCSAYNTPAESGQCVVLTIHRLGVANV